MSEREQQIMETFAKALPKMSEYERGYFMGRAEGMLAEKNKKQREKTESEQKGA